VTADPPAPPEVPTNGSTDPKLLAALLGAGFAVVAFSGMALRSAFNSRLSQYHGYSSAHLLVTVSDDEEETSGTLSTLSVNGHGGAE